MPISSTGFFSWHTWNVFMRNWMVNDNWRELESDFVFVAASLRTRECYFWKYDDGDDDKISTSLKECSEASSCGYWKIPQRFDHQSSQMSLWKIRFHRWLFMNARLRGESSSLIIKNIFNSALDCRGQKIFVGISFHNKNSTKGKQTPRTSLRKLISRWHLCPRVLFSADEKIVADLSRLWAIRYHLDVLCISFHLSPSLCWRQNNQ